MLYYWQNSIINIHEGEIKGFSFRNSFEVYKYVIDKELQHTDDFIFCVTLFAFDLVLDKIS